MSIKIKSISGFNFAGYSSIQVNLDNHATYFIGRNGSGKSVLGLDLVWFVMQGIAEKSMNGTTPFIGERFRFIGDAAKTAMGELVLWDEEKGHEIRVIRKLTKTGTELSFSAPIGMELDQQWLNNLFNLFLISPKKFIELSSKEQAIALGINTSEYDLKIAALKEQYTDINKDLKKYQNLQVIEKVERVDITETQQLMAEARQRFVEQHRANQTKNRHTKEIWEADKKAVDEEVARWNNEQTELDLSINTIKNALIDLREAGYTGDEVSVFLMDKEQSKKPLKIAQDLYPAEPTNLEYKPLDYIPAEGEMVYIRELPDQTEIDELQNKLLQAGQTNENALLYEQYLQNLDEKAAKEKELQENKSKQNTLEDEKVEYIKAFKLPFDKLSVDEDGGLLLNGKPLKPQYFSSGELIRIVPSLISSLNPEFKYVFLQEFDLLDEETQVKVENELTSKGFQLVIELVGKEKLPEKNCILLRNSQQVEKYPEPKVQNLLSE